MKEYPKYITVNGNGIIVEDKEEENSYIETVTIKKEEKNESTNKDISKGVNTKKSNAHRSLGDGGKSKQ